MRAKHPEKYPGMEEHAVNILNTLGDAIIAVDGKFRVVYANKKFCLLLGPGVNDLVGKYIVDLIPEAGGWMFHRYLEKAISEGSQVELDNFMFRNKRFTTYFYPNDNGITVVLHDITTQWHTDELYRLALMLLDKLSENVCLVRSDGRIFHPNDEISRLLGYTRDELIHMKISDIDPNITVDGWESHFKRIKEAAYVGFESSLKAKDGRIIPVDICANYIELYDLEYYCVAARDITERRRTDKELKDARAQAELYMDLMGHDINNLNQSAMGYLELAIQALEAEKGLRLDDMVLLEKPMQALSNSTTLINNVRKLQRLLTEGIKAKPIELQIIFRELGAMDFHLQGRDVVVNIQDVPGVMVEADELLKDVFFNLVANAIKHSDEEKPLKVNVKVKTAKENGKKYYKCVVEDNGPGITDEMKSKLFHRFQRGTTKAHGKGLGLYLVRTLVEGYHGQVRIEDRIKGDHTKGARFVVILPAVEK